MTEFTDKEELIAQYLKLPMNSDYMRVVAHDVRNYMNTVVLATDIVSEEIKDADGNPQKYVDMICKASQNILVILEAAVLAAEGRDEAE